MSSINTARNVLSDVVYAVHLKLSRGLKHNMGHAMIVHSLLVIMNTRSIETEKQASDCLQAQVKSPRNFTTADTAGSSGRQQSKKHMHAHVLRPWEGQL